MDATLLARRKTAGHREDGERRGGSPLFSAPSSVFHAFRRFLSFLYRRSKRVAPNDFPMLKLYNTLTSRVEEFHPLNQQEARMYVCGPTVYDYAHIGNFRTFLFADLLRRYIKYKGYRPRHVMNITDVDDKIIERAVESGKPLREFTDQYIRFFFEDFDALGAERPEEILRATDHIPEMVELVKRLGSAGHTYQSDGSTYFRIASFEKYGRLSKMNFEGVVAGASERIDADQYDKENARDFVLWKAAKPGEPFWETELGKGRPGWHIECS